MAGKDRNSTGLDREAIRSLIPYLWPKGERGMRARVVIALAFLVLSKIATVYTPLFFGNAVDALSPAGEAAANLAIALPIGLILAYGLSRVLAQAFAQLRDAVFARVAQQAIRRAALNVFRHLHALSLRFHMERQTGGLSRIIERGVKSIESMLSFMLFNVLPTILEILLVAGILWTLFDFWFAAITMASVVAYIAFTMIVTEWRLKFRRQMNESDQDANTKAIDSLLNFETVKYFGNEDHEASRFDRAMGRYEKAAVRSTESLALLNIGQGVLIAVGLTLIMLMAASRIQSGAMTVGGFVAVNTYLIQLYQPLNFFGFVYRTVKQALVDMHAMFDLLNVAPDVTDKPDAPPLRVEGGRIEFRDVHFGYDPRRPILKGVSFTVEPGRSLAIVGPTGAGKSTISRLLFRFYDAGEGAILIDGQDIRDVGQKSLRAAIGIVPQDTVLFNDTIYYNIDYGRPGAGREAIEEAARLARIEDFIATLPDGYDTVVGERGLKLSGGEKQRVAIARTLLKDPPIMMFDEATSALDTHTERAIQGNLDEVSQGRTTLMIAHRLSTVINADEIIVLKDGQVVERGRHDALLDRDGEYATLWRRQQEMDTDDIAEERRAARRAALAE
ncbi:MAG: ABC transporter ATP-binding protein/permease [Azospirillaceae bacterium]